MLAIWSLFSLITGDCFLEFHPKRHAQFHGPMSTHGTRPRWPSFCIMAFDWLHVAKQAENEGHVLISSMNEPDGKVIQGHWGVFKKQHLSLYFTTWHQICISYPSSKIKHGQVQPKHCYYDNSNNIIYTSSILVIKIFSIFYCKCPSQINYKYHPEFIVTPWQ